MKVCPECGFIDRSMWRQNKWRTNVDFIKVEYEEDVPLEILKAYKDARGYATDENYAYRLCQRQGIIERILIEEWTYCGGRKAFHTPREKVDHSIMIHVPKLSEFNGVVPPNRSKER